MPTTLTKDTRQYDSVPITAALIPREGPLTVPLTLDFTAQNSWSVDLTNLQSRGALSVVQTLFVDNSGNATAVTFTFRGSQQLIYVRPRSQGYFPVLAPNPIAFTAISTGGLMVDIQLINSPMPALTWDVAGASGSNTYSNGALVVTDTSLDSAIANGRLQAQEYRTGNGDFTYPAWVGNVAYSAQLTASANNIIAGAPGFFITGIQVSVSPTAATSAGGLWTVSVSDSSTGVIWRGEWWLPSASAAPTVPTVSLARESAAGFRWNNKVALSTLSVVLSAGLTAGKAIVNISYGTTAVVG